MSKETETSLLKKKLAPLKKKLDFTYIAIIVLSIALYVGFDDLISGAVSGTARDTISAALAAIFVLITTMYMLNKQSDIEQDKKYKAEIFTKKFQLYDDLITNWLNIAYIDKSINKENYKECLDNHYEILMVAPGNAVERSAKIMAIVSTNYQDRRIKKLDDDDLDEIKAIINEFTKIVREELSISKIPVNVLNPEYIEDNEQIVNGKNLDKFEFQGKKYNKGRLVIAVVRHTVSQKKVKTIDDLKQLFPDSYWSKGKESNSKNRFIVELKHTAEKNKARFFRKSEDMIQLFDSDAEVIVNNQWGTNFDHFRREVQTNLNYEIKRHGPKQ